MRWLVDLCVRFAGTIATLTLVALAAYLASFLIARSREAATADAR